MIIDGFLFASGSILALGAIFFVLLVFCVIANLMSNT